MRPKIYDQEILEIFYKSFADDLKKNSCEMCDGMSLEEIENGLMYAGTPEFDGYDYAKKLERYGWSGITAGDVEILDCAHSFLSDVHDDAVRKWVIDNDIKPELKDGDFITYKNNICTVHYIDRTIALAKYLVRSRDWLVRNGDKGGVHVNFEDIDNG
ncbi:MAG: hypothetical protein WC756_21165 [Taibaiella sp.]|jgi:hypothetical protein